jgi:glycyl-tRNA synthetase
MWGIANRGNYDLNAHSQATNANLWYLDPISQQKIIPFVIEPSVSVERLFYALITDKYANESLTNDETREVLHLSYKLAPYKVAVLPLTNKLTDQANIIYQQLLDANISTCFDTSGSIGKRYRRQDAIGTPHCITFDFDSLNNRDVTVRDRDSMKQMRVKIDELINFFNNRAKHD